MKRYILVIFVLLLSAFVWAEDKMVKGAEAFGVSGEPVAVWEAELLGKARTGRVVKDPEASGGKARRCDVYNASDELMLYGQYQSLPAGKYIAVFRIKAANIISSGDYVINLDVAANGGAAYGGKSRFFKNSFTEGYVLFPYPFEVKEKDEKIEARVWWGQNSDIWVDKVEIYKCSGPLPKEITSPVPMLKKLEPGLYPDNLSYTPVSFPTKDLFPVSEPVSQHMYAVDVTQLGVDENTMLATIQGLVNREKPRLYLSSGEMDRFWLQRLVEQKHIKTVTWLSAKEAVNKFRKYIKGAVITDPSIPATVNAATMYAAVNDLAVCRARVADKYNLPVKLDMRGMFEDNSQPYYWAWATLWDKLNHHAASCLYWNVWQTRDYLVQHKLFVFWVPGRIDAATDASQPEDEMLFANYFLSRLPANTPIMGYPWAGVDIGIGEGGGVGLFAKYGHYLVGSTNGTNISVHSGTRRTELKQKTRPRSLKLDNSKIYVAFTMSDGDNLPVLYEGNWPQMWQTEARGKTPITWTISPASCVLLPDIMEYYYSTATENDTFSAAVSGVGYTYPALYGQRFRKEDRKAVFDDFLKLTDRYMKEMDLNVLMPMNVTPREIALMAEGLPWVKGMFPDYSRNVTLYSDSIFMTSGNVPVLRSGTTWDPDNTEFEYMAQRMAKEIEDFPAPAEGEPGFIHAFLWNWGYDPARVNRITELLSDRYVFVSAEEMAALEKEFLQSKQLIVSGPAQLAVIGTGSVKAELAVQNTTDKPLKAVFTMNGAACEPVEIELQPGVPETVVMEGVPERPRVLVEYAFGDKKGSHEILVNRYDDSTIPAGLNIAGAELVAHYGANELKSNNSEVFTADDGIKYRAAIAGKSDDGAIIFGPYLAMDPGKYVAVYNLVRLDEKGEDETVCTLDIVPAATKDQVFEKKLDRTMLPVGKKVTLYAPFTWSSDKGVETRVFWEKTSDSVRVDGVSIFRLK